MGKKTKFDKLRMARAEQKREDRRMIRLSHMRSAVVRAEERAAFREKYGYG